LSVGAVSVVRSSAVEPCVDVLSEHAADSSVMASTTAAVNGVRSLIVMDVPSSFDLRGT
jgi:hypothetical protein